MAPSRCGSPPGTGRPAPDSTSSSPSYTIAVVACTKTLPHAGQLDFADLPAGARPGDRDRVLGATVAAALGGGEVLRPGGDERQAGRAEGPQRGDRRGPGRGLLLVGPDLGHARGGVQALEGGGLLGGDKPVHPGHVVGGGFGV